MTYSVDLRQRVVNYVNNGGNVKEAKKLFNIGKATIYRWLGSPTLVPKKVETRSRKLNRVALENDVKENPDISIKERAKKFNVSPSAICYAFKKMNITRKKNSYVIEKGIEKKESSTTDY